MSCIVPVFNGERYLGEALDSAFGQTHPPLEVIVVDDGSSDATPDVIAAYGERVRALRQDNAGPAAARNLGLRAARGDFVAFLDADDVWHPDKVARQLAHFEQRPELDVSVTHAQNFWIPELREEAERYREHRFAQPLPAFLAASLLAPRRVFERVGEFDASLRFGHSTDWFLRAAERGVVVEVLDEVLYHRRIHRHNRSRLLNAASREEFLELVKRHLDRQRARAGSEGAGSAAPAGQRGVPRSRPRRD